MNEDNPKMDLDEPVNAEMDPEDALRLLLGEERREQDTEDGASYMSDKKHPAPE